MNPPAPKVVAGWLFVYTVSQVDGVGRESAIHLSLVETVCPMVGPDQEGRCGVLMLSGAEHTVLATAPAVMAAIMGTP